MRIVVAADDVGKAIHPVMCAGQIEGGTLQAIGWAVLEEIRAAPTGRIHQRRT